MRNFDDYLMRITIKCTLTKPTDPGPATSFSTAARNSNPGHSGRFSTVWGVRNSNQRQFKSKVTAPTHTDSDPVQSDPPVKVTNKSVPPGSTTKVSNLAESKTTDNLDSNLAESTTTDNLDSNLAESKTTDNLDSNQAESKTTDNLDSNQAVPGPECVGSPTLNNNITMVVGGFCGGVLLVLIVGSVVLLFKKVVTFSHVYHHGYQIKLDDKTFH